MGASFSGAATRGCRAATSTLIAAAIALTALALLAGTAAAQPAAPEAVLTAKPSPVTSDVSPAFAFTALNGTDETRFECRLDGELVACVANGATGTYVATNIAEGNHTFAVRATNAEDATADEWGPTATYDFRVDRTTPAVTIDPPSPAPATAGANAPAAVVPAAAQARVPRIEIGTACMEVSAARASARFSLRGRNAIVRFRAPAAARYAKFTLRKAAGGRRRGAVVATLASVNVAGTGTARIALTGGQRRLIRSGATRLAVAYGTCRSPLGEWQWVGTGSAV